LHGLAQLFRYGRYDLFYVRSVGDSLLHERKALVNGFADASDGLQDRVQLSLLSPAAPRSCLSRRLFFCQSTPM
jgi:hypothetical protein